MQGFHVRMGGMPFEATTPTGAALMKGLEAQSCLRALFTPDRAGYGLGMRDAEIPNVLRVWLGEARTEETEDGACAEKVEGYAPETNIGEAYVLETNIDDMNPEWFPFVEEKLFAAGAADVYRTPILMKKGRSAIQMNVLVPDRNVLEQAQDILLTHTTTLGVRCYRVEKAEAVRRQSVVATDYGSVRVKWVQREGRTHGKPEFEDCRKIAEEQDLTLHEVYLLVTGKIMADSQNIW
jgi:uncharacterized protein (DUF111 family)